MTYTTEITSDRIASDNPVHQRLLKAYYLTREEVSGDLLEVGCGEGRGIDLLLPKVKNYTAIDKNEKIISQLADKYPSIHFQRVNIPPLAEIDNEQFNYVISFQVIEHIGNDRLFLQEIKRSLKSGGKAFITTPNRKMSLTRNPWHVREYTADQLHNLLKDVFDKVEMKGITGNDKVMDYYEENKRSVEKITRFDILNLQYKLPAALLRVPYDLLNRFNRNRLKESNRQLVTDISSEDYIVTEDLENCLDFYCRVS